MLYPEGLTSCGFFYTIIVYIIKIVPVGPSGRAAPEHGRAGGPCERIPDLMNAACTKTVPCMRQIAVQFPCKGVPAPAFRPLTLEDKNWVTQLLAAEQSPAASGSFGTHLLWGPSYGQQVARVGDRLLCRYTDEKRHVYAFPYGSGELKQALCALSADAAAHSRPLTMVGVTAAQKEQLEHECPDAFTFAEDRGRADYLYDPERLATLSGRKLQSKRNHCNRFVQEQPDWHFDRLTAEQIPACMALFEDWVENHAGLPAEEIEAERRAIRLALEHRDELSMLGGVLFAGGRLVGFTLGEMGAAGSFDVHFEKALPEVNGAYPMVNREFVRLLRETYPELRYVNREEDLDMENLRAAKLSYQPALLLEKFTATAASCI